MRRLSMVPIAFGLLAISSVVVAAAADKDLVACDSQSWDTRVAGCTRALNKRHWPHKALAILHFQRGQGYQRLGQFERAIEDYNEAIKYNPNSDAIYSERGDCEVALGDFARGLEDANRALKLNPKDAATYNVLGLAMHHTARYDEAVAAFTKGIQYNGKLMQLYANRSISWLVKKELDRALTDIDTAIKLAPDNGHLYSNRCSVWNEKNESDNAITDCSKAIQLSPDYASAYVNRGIAFFAKGEFDRSLSDYSQAIRLDPTNGGAYDGRADVLRKKGQFDKALSDIERASSLNPQSVTVFTTKGQILEAEGKLDAAHAAYAKAVELPVVASYKGGQGIYTETYERDQATAKTRLALLSGAAPATAPATAPSPSAPTATPTPAPAAQPPAATEQKKTENGRIRIALVIGNGAYKGATALPNPPNDARALATTLRGMGFEVSEGINLDHVAMEKTTRDFLLKAPKASIALLFYAGHGIQIDGKNFLVPVDADVTSAEKLMAGMTALDTILAGLDDRIRTNIVILDACRDNPLVKKEIAENAASRSLKIGAGLASPGELGKGATLGAGTLIAFATSPGAVALDGNGANSPFSAALVHHINTPGLEVQQMLTRVRAEVVAATDNKQVPWSNSSLLGDTYLAAGKH